MASLEDFFVQPLSSAHPDNLAFEHTTTEDILDEYTRFNKQLRRRFCGIDNAAGYQKVVYPLFLSCLGEAIRNECPATVVRRFYAQHASLFLHDAGNAATIQAVMEAAPSNLGSGWPGPRTFDVTLSDEENRLLCDALQSEEFFQMALAFDKLVTLTVVSESSPAPPQRFGEMSSACPSPSARSVSALHAMRSSLESLSQHGSSTPPLHVHHISVPDSEARLSCAAVSANRVLLVCGAERAGILLRPLSSGAVLAELLEPSPVGASRAHLARDSCLSLGRHTAPVAGYRAEQEAATGVRWLRGHRGPVTDVRFFDGERYLLSASTDSTVRLWDSLLGENIAIYDSHSKAVLVCDVSAPLSMFATGSTDTLCHVWSTERMVPVRTFAGHEGPVQEASLHPNVKSMATCSEADGLRLWDVSSGRHVFHLTRQVPVAVDGDGDAARTHKQPMYVGFNRAAWSPCGMKVVLLGVTPARKDGPILSMYDMRSLSTPVYSVRLSTSPSPSFCRPVWSHDGTALAVAARDGSVLIWAPFSDSGVPKTEVPIVRHPVDRRRVQSALSISCFPDNACYVVGQAAGPDAV